MNPPPASPLPSSENEPQIRKVIRSTLVSRNVTIAGHRTSVRLEPDMWSGLSEICRRERASIHDICTKVAEAKSDNTSLTAAIRVYVMTYYRSAATDEGHVKAGHGYYGTTGTMTSSVAAAPSASASGSRILSPPYMMGAGRVTTSSGSMR